MTLKLLLAEDDVELREVLIEALTLESFEVVACDNAEDALDIASEQHFDLALFDVVMTGMTGIEAISTLRGSIQTLALSSPLHLLQST